jgi:hypothetical protein
MMVYATWERAHAGIQKAAAKAIQTSVVEGQVLGRSTPGSARH